MRRVVCDVVTVLIGAVLLQIVLSADKDNFSCEGRASGYYADVNAGCQVYHMCDGLGRQFSYSCPNTTLFQQRMLICDHWYMVNCSKSELDYGANLLIGQRDKPFVDDSSENPYHRTPRPDLLTHPYAPSFQSDYRQAKAQYGTSQNLVGVEREPANNRSTDGPVYFLPSHWSTEYSKLGTTPLPFVSKKGIKSAISGTEKVVSQLRLDPKLVKITKSIPVLKNIEKKDVITPSRFTLPPFAPSLVPRTTFTTTEFPDSTLGLSTTRQQFASSSSPSFRTKPPPSGTFQSGKPFISSLPSTKKEPNFGFNDRKLTSVPSLISKRPGETYSTTKLPPRLQNVSSFIPTRPSPSTILITPQKQVFPRPSANPLVTNDVEPPSIYYQPPKLSTAYQSESTTMDPRTFYKLVPSKELQPPKIKHRSDDERSIIDTTTTLRSVTKKDTTNPALSPPSSTQDKTSSERRWKELRQMFFIPEYDFPLDLESRPGYESGVSSFQARQVPQNPESKPKDSVQPPSCDSKCDPTFLIPGTCKPCVMIRR